MGEAFTPDAGMVSTLRDLALGRSLYPRLGLPKVRARRRDASVAMFDVFDTLITRSVVTPSAVWYRSAELLIERSVLDVAAADYVRVREAAAEVSAEQFRNCAVFETIHQRVGLLLGLPDDSWVITASAEIEVEQTVSRPVRTGQELLAAARKQGLRVLFVSDMHLPSMVIRSLLQLHECWCDGDELWVSSEAGARKRTGELFVMISQTSRIDLSSAIHIGDVGGHEILPGGGHVAARWRPTELPRGGHLFCPR